MGVYDGWSQPNQYNREPYNGYGQMQQPQVAQNPFLMVPTIADVDKVVAQAGETRWIMVQNDAVIAVKKANAVGYATTEYYRLSNFEPAAMQTPAEAQYLTAAQAEQKIQAAVKAEVERVMAQYQTAPAAPARPARAKEG